MRCAASPTASRTALARLLDGSRPDWGAALLVGMARLAALETSLREGRLRVLDAFADDAARLAPDLLALRPEILPAVADESAGLVREARRRFLARPSQAAWADLEDAANRHLELLRASREGTAMRAQAERLVPERRATLADLVAPLAEPAALARALALAGERERGLAAELRRLHGYHLVRHNCVSALFATVNSAFPDPVAGSTAALGGHVDPERGLAFVPFVSAARVARAYRVRERFTIPSLRRARVARMRAREGSLRVRLREASPLTARAYARGARDSFFLFFTDDVFWPRPLLGALNLAAGAGELALGILRAPLDGGRTLLRGVEGTLMSLPELAFVNLRKGSHDWVPPEAWAEIAARREDASEGWAPAAIEPGPASIR